MLPKTPTKPYFSFINWLIDHISGDKNTPINERILNVFCLLVGISFFYFVACSAIFFQRLDYCHLHIIWGSVSLFSFYLSYQLKYSKIAMILMIAVAYTSMTDTWVNEGGYFGPFLLMFLTYVVYYSFMLPRYWRLFFIVGNLLYAFCLQFIPCQAVIGTADFIVFRLLTTLACSTIAIYCCTSILDYSYERERRIAESRQHSLQEITKLQTQMIAIISHDVRAPLANIELLLDMLNRNMLSPEQQADMLRKLQKSVGQSREVLESMVGWTRAQVQSAHAEGAASVQCDVKKVIDDSLQDWQDLAATKKLQLQFTTTDSDVITVADSNLIRTTVRNLVMNAIKFTHEGGTIQLQLATDQHTATITVADNGVGIAPDRLAQLFRDRIISKRGTNSETGSGIGLWIVYDMVQRAGGNLTVTSELEKGSTFKVTLPLAKTV
jgi:two-component system, sensor histidine kinase and response regulator